MKIENIRSKFLEKVNQIKNSQEFEELRIKYLGRKGFIQELYSSMPKLSPEDRPTFGKEVNDLRNEIEGKIEELKTRFAKKKTEKILDTSLPGRAPFIGRKHPLTQVQEDIKRFFLRLGFSVADGPDVETDFYNFTALNFPENHPARAMQDTLFISNDIVLRTHTSPVQIRTHPEPRLPRDGGTQPARNQLANLERSTL